MTLKTHAYKGRTIRPASNCEMIKAGLKWYIEATHVATGMAYSEDVCRHYHTLVAAKKAIRETAAHQEWDAELVSFVPCLDCGERFRYVAGRGASGDYCTACAPAARAEARS